MHLTVVVTYLLILVGVGVYKSRKIKTQSDFAVAGRSLTPWVLVGTMLATWIGTGSILGNAGKTYETGMAALILPIGGTLGILILTRVSGKVRKFEKITVPEILGERYGPSARLLSLVALVTAYMVIVSYQYNAGGAVLQTVLTDTDGNSLISIETGTIIAAVFIILYTLLAGLLSVAYTDVWNGIIMTVSLIIAFPILLGKAGGMSGMEAAFAEIGKPEHMQFFGVYSILDVINFCLPPFLLVLGDANMYQRFSASKDAKGATKATLILVVAVLIIELLIIACAWISASLIPETDSGRYVLIYASHTLLPAFLGAIMMTTIVGIIISTADSFLLVPANSLIRDVYLTYINPRASEKKIVFLSRVTVFVLGIIAYVVSLVFARSTTIFEKALYAYTIYGAAITPSLFAAFFWKGATKAGAVASIISGTAVTLIWKEVTFIRRLIPESIYGNLDEVLPAITVSLVLLVSVSLLTQEKE